MKMNKVIEIYEDARNQIPEDSILFYKLGDFYESFGDDARYVSRKGQLTLTAIPKTKIPMCGVIFYMIEEIAEKLNKQVFIINPIKNKAHMTLGHELKELDLS